MKLSEVSIARPVLATVMTLLLVLFGLMAFTKLSVREYPDIDPTIVKVRTVYPGASARLVETDVTTILEDSLSGIEGLKTLSSVSREETSVITLEFVLSRDVDDAANDVRDRVLHVRRQLPLSIEEPIVAKELDEGDEILFIALASDRHSELAITDFADRHVKSRLSILPGVSSIYLDGERLYAMRVWLDSDRLASRQLTVQDVEQALLNQNAAFPSGRIESDHREFSVQTAGDLRTPEQFNQLVIAYRDGYPIRLQDVGIAELGAEDDRKIVRVNGKPAIGLAIVKKSKANTLSVAQTVKQELSSIRATLPSGMVLDVAFDSSIYIEESIREVYYAMGLALVLVVIVIYLFLGSARATIIPTVAIPASIIGALTLLYLFGFSINVMTLLGFVLAIGLVVDDVIVVLENIHRRIEHGEAPLPAAVAGAREIGFAVVATTLSLVAVFIPIAFLTGPAGRLFGELGLAVVGSVLLSGFVALTLTPMMCSMFLSARSRSGRLHRFSERALAELSERYGHALARSLRARSAIVFLGVAALLASGVLMMSLPAELAPMEDTGWFVSHVIAPEGSTIRYTDLYARQQEDLFRQVPEIETTYTVVARGIRPTIVNRAASWATLVPWNQRDRTQEEIVAELSKKIESIPAVKANVISPPPLNQSAGKDPVQLVIGGTSYAELERHATVIVERAKQFNGLTDLDTNMELNKPELAVSIHRDKAADLGIAVATVGRTLETLLGGRRVTTFIRDGKAYNVMVKIRDRDRATPSDIGKLYVRGNGSQLIPLNNLVTLRERAAPQALYHHDKMRSVTISAGMAEGATLGGVLDFLERTAREVLPPGSRISYAGESKEFKETSEGLYMVFGLAILVIYLVLAAQFESFIHPLTILLAVPPAVTGALLTLAAFGGTLNIYSQLGMVMLIGLVTKNAILIVEFANQLQARGREVGSAIIEAATLRLRPILMTTAATLLGALPLALATGAGAAGRRQIGYVVIGGLVLSTLLTLFLVPAVYTALSRRPRPERQLLAAVPQLILETRAPESGRHPVNKHV